MSADRARLLCIALFFALLVALSSSPSEISAQRRIIDDLFEGASKAGRGAARSGIQRLSDVADPVALRNLPKSERDALWDAENDFIVRSSVSLTDSLDALEQAASALSKNSTVGRLGRPLPDYQFVQVRLAADEALDEAIGQMARSRLNPMLSQPFDRETLRVVPLALADDAGASAAEMARVASIIGREHIDSIGPLSRLGSWARENGDLVARLKPYRGKTVVLLGHLPEKSRAFFVFGPRGERFTIDMDALLRAADEAGVNLVPLGCHSAELAPIGLAGRVNSHILARRLRSVSVVDPSTMGEFLAHIAGDDLQLVVNALSLRLHSSGAPLLSRRNLAEAARIGLRTVPKFNAALSKVDFDPCFGAASSADFDRCAIALAEQEARLIAQEEEAYASAMRERALATMPARLATKTAELSAQRRSWMLYALGYILVMPIIWLAFLHSVCAFPLAEDDGKPVMHGFKREYIIKNFELFPHLDVIDAIKLLALASGSGFAVALPFFASERGLWGAIYGGLAGGLALGAIIEAFKENRSYPLVRIPIVALGALLAALFTYEGLAVEALGRDLDHLLSEKADLEHDGPNAAWRADGARSFRYVSSLNY